MTTLLVDVDGPRPLRAVLVTTGHAGVRRVRVALRPARTPDRLAEDTHLRVRMPADAAWPTLADVLLERGGGATADELAARHPGALVVAAHLGTRCRLRLRGQDPKQLALGPVHFAGLSWQSWASLAHAWLVAGLPGAELAASRVRVLRVSRAPVNGVPRTHGRAPRYALPPATPRAAPAAPSPRG